MIKNWKKEIFTIPNALSMFRLVLIPVYVAIYLGAEKDYEYYIAAGILAVSCLTDLIDGKIARHFNMISTVGIILDPVADKATQFALILCLAMRFPVLWYLIGLFVVKETFQVIAGGLSLRRGKMLNGALISGKICTTVLFISLILLVILSVIPDLSDKVVTAITVIDMIFMLTSFGNYLFTYFARDNKFLNLEESKNSNKDSQV